MDARLADYVRGQWPALVRYATALCGDPIEAEELVQSALVRVALRWPFVRDKDNPDGYVRRAIVNGRTSRWRKLRRESLVDLVPEHAPYVDHPAHDDTLWQLLATLPRRQRAVLVLRYYEDMSEDQIAATLGCAPGTVKSQASKALAKLRAALDADQDLREATWTG